MSSSRAKRWRWRDPIYGTDIELVVGGELGPWMDRLSQRFNYQPLSDEDRLAMTGAFAAAPFYRNGKDSLLFFWFDAKVRRCDAFWLSTISHEACHGTAAIFRDKNIPIALHTDEPFAYHQTWLFAEIYKRVGGVR